MFLIGGINGAFAAVVPIDFAITDTYFVVAHLHYVLFGGSVFAIFAGFYFWMPKMTGRFLDERLGKIQFWIMLIGFNLTFFPMHMLGLMGMQRRVADYAPNAGFTGYNELATAGAFLIALSVLMFIVNFVITHAQAAHGDRRPVGGEHPGVGDLVAAARPQLRPADPDPLRAAGVRPPAQARRGASP